jgi:GNAT superfamily N-acetyltransferase
VIAITSAEPEHAGAIAALLEEMRSFYGAAESESAQRRVQQVTEVLFGDLRGISALLAWDDTQLAGLAAYSFLWPAAGLTRSLYLKELYVGQAHRRRGVGQLLMEGLREVAARHRCSRLEWTADDDNAAARSFYAGLGVPVRTSKLFYRIELGQPESG